MLKSVKNPEHLGDSLDTGRALNVHNKFKRRLWSHVLSVHVLCSGGSLYIFFLSHLRNIFQTLQKGVKKTRNWSLFKHPEKIKKSKTFYVFRGYSKRSVTWNGLVDEIINFLPTSNATVGFSTSSKTILYQERLQPNSNCKNSKCYESSKKQGFPF